MSPYGSNDVDHIWLNYFHVVWIVWTSDWGSSWLVGPNLQWLWAIPHIASTSRDTLTLADYNIETYAIQYSLQFHTNAENCWEIISADINGLYCHKMLNSGSLHERPHEFFWGGEKFFWGWGEGEWRLLHSWTQEKRQFSKSGGKCPTHQTPMDASLHVGGEVRQDRRQHGRTATIRCLTLNY